jgi:hypothetical protein
MERPAARPIPHAVLGALGRASPLRIGARGVTRRWTWAIGMYAGQAPTSWAPMADVRNPVLTYKDVDDVPAAFVADPFLLHVDGTWHMFFEVWNRERDRGEIGLATSRDARTWTYQQIVLREPFHLSYPHVFAHDGAVFMTPESRADDSVRLYRADPFPTRWVLDTTLLEARAYADPTPFRHDGRWWMYVDVSPVGALDTLALFSADALHGPWVEHPRSPVCTDAAHARPGGRVLRSGERLHRLGQDCAQRYGERLWAVEITALSTTDYAERRLPAPALTTGRQQWSRSKMHHLDGHQLPDGSWIACVDGK